MKAWQKGTADGVRERYLGEIAPLLAAASTVDDLSAVERDRIRKQILRTAFGYRSIRRRGRLVPVLVGLGLLVVGGMAFATAERFGLIRAFDRGKPTPTQVDVNGDHGKRRGGHQAIKGGPQAAVDHVVPEALPLPEVPDPLLDPVAPSRRPFQAQPPAGPGGANASAMDAPAMASPPMHSSAVGSTAMDSSTQDGPSSPAVRVKSAWRHARRLAFALSLPRLQVEDVPLAQPARVGSLDLVPAASSDQPALAGAVAIAAPAPPRPQLTPKPADVAVAKVSDQGLFGQAMRKLRWEHDPTAALGALQDHARAYPNSTLRGERSLLEVEALLALHRDREALARLDAMTVEELPRSGERFVVRGELRASARRWMEASADFDQALARMSGSPAWHERALWGRAVARLHCGEREAGMADMELYRDTYPAGRFAGEVAKFFPEI